MDRSHVINILPKRLEEYMREAEYDLKLDEINIKEKALLRSSLGCKWTRYLFEEERYKKTLLNQIDILKDQIKQKLFISQQNAISTQSSAAEKLISISLEKALIADPTYKKLKEALNAQDDIIRLINEIQKQISMFGYDLTNAREILKLEQI